MKLSKIAKQIILEQSMGGQSMSPGSSGPFMSKSTTAPITGMDPASAKFTAAVKREMDDKLFDTLTYTSADAIWEVKVSADLASNSNAAKYGIPLYQNKFEYRNLFKKKLSPSYNTWTPEQKRNGIAPDKQIFPKGVDTVTADNLMMAAKVTAEVAILKSKGQNSKQFDADYTDSEVNDLDSNSLPTLGQDTENSFKVPTPNNINTVYKAIDFLESYYRNLYGATVFEYVRPYLGKNGTNNLLLRGKDIVWYYNGRIKKKTEWTDTFGPLNDIPEFNVDQFRNLFWDKSIYVGNDNINWLKSIPVSQSTKDKNLQAVDQKGTVSKLDKLCVDLCFAAATGTNEDMIVNVVKKISNTREFLIISKMLQDVAKLYDDTEEIFTTDPYDFYMFRAPEVMTFKFKDFETMYGYDIARAINPYALSLRASSLYNMRKTGTVSDRLLKYTSISGDMPPWTGGFADYLTAEMNAGSDRDSIMLILIKKGICGWQPTNDIVLFPGGGKVSADDDLVKEMSGIGYKKPGSDKELTGAQKYSDDYKSTRYKPTDSDIEGSID